jgi:hypothetical protein
MLERSAQRIPAERRTEFLFERDRLADELMIDDYEVVFLEMGKGEDKGEKATVQVRWTWHRDSKGIVHKTTTRQSWSRKGKRWLLTAEEHLLGEPMPGISTASGRLQSAQKTPTIRASK